MPQARHTHVLFDFFGTLVDYSASLTDRDYALSHDLVRRLGANLSYADFLELWSRTSDEFYKRSDQDDHEFSMTEVCGEFLTRALGRRAAPAAVKDFVDVFIAEWNIGVHYLPGLPDLIAELAATYRLAIVTNTHQADLVPNHLAAMGLSDAFDVVIRSVEVGWRKPHPRIYATALDALGIDASAAVFVGDTYGPDYEGPARAGMTAFLIDPEHATPVPAGARLSSLFDLPAALGTPEHTNARRR